MFIDLELTKISVVVLSIIIISLLIYSFIPFKIIRKKNNEDTPVNKVIHIEKGFPIIEDILNIIERECDKVIDLRFTYSATKHAYSLKHSSLINPSNVIKDDDLDSAVIDTSNKIIENLSGSYRYTLSLV